MVTCEACGLLVRTPLEAQGHPCQDAGVREFGTHHVEPERAADGRVMAEALADWRLRGERGPMPAAATVARGGRR